MHDLLLSLLMNLKLNLNYDHVLMRQQLVMLIISFFKFFYKKASTYVSVIGTIAYIAIHFLGLSTPPQITREKWDSGCCTILAGNTSTDEISV